MEGLALAPSSCLLSLSWGALFLPRAQGRVTTFPSTAEMAKTMRVSGISDDEGTKRKRQGQKYLGPVYSLLTCLSDSHLLFLKSKN